MPDQNLPSADASTPKPAEGQQEAAPATPAPRDTAPEADVTKAAPVVDPTKPAPKDAPVDTKPTDAKPDATKDAPKDTKVEGAPEKYEFKAPQDIKLDDQVVVAFSEVAKDLNLTQDNAQKILDKVAPLIELRAKDALTAQRTTWVEQAKADKEIGGEKLAENLAIAKKAYETFGSKELGTFLEQTGLGDNPHLIRAFLRAGKAISEDRIVPGEGSRASATDAASKLYPNQSKTKE